jgi:hypothetical protein
MKSPNSSSAAQLCLVSCTLCGKHQLDGAKLMHVTPALTVCVECIDLMHATIHGYAPADPLCGVALAKDVVLDDPHWVH